MRLSTTASVLSCAVAASLFAVLTAASAAPASDPDHPAWAKPYVGRWTLSGVSEGDPVCGLTLKPDASIGGAQIEVSATCRRNYDFEDVAGWRLDGQAIVLIDALRKPLVRFKSEPDRSWSASLPGDLGVSLERGAPEKPKSIRALFEDEGTFSLSGPNNTKACGFSVTATSASGGKLEQWGRCAAPWKGKPWASWRVTGDRLELRDAKGGVILALTRADEYSFTAKTAGGMVFFGPGTVDGSEALEGR